RTIERWLPDRVSDEALAPDVVATLRQLGGDEFLREVAVLFLIDVPPRLQTIREAVKNCDAAALASSAHALKSSAGNMGAMLMRRLAEMLEQIGNGGSVAEAAPLVEELTEEFARVEKELGSFRS
ncbi:MAG TPA: Hpt domain-containing protein, partial [Thermoanaerobaculia bacterium]|nr:Hpt domain-containing protein [Thermoanaerobaculia bacterium]